MIRYCRHHDERPEHSVLHAPADLHRAVTVHGEDEYKGNPIGTAIAANGAPRSTPSWEAFDDHFRGARWIDTVREEHVPEASVRAVARRTGEADRRSGRCCRGPPSRSAMILTSNPTYLQPIANDEQHPSAVPEKVAAGDDSHAIDVSSPDLGQDWR